MADTFTKAERSHIMAAVKGKDTTPEMIVRRLVHRMGFRYRLHVRALPGTPDLAFPRLRKIINVSGCFWHMHGCGRCRIPATRRDYWIGKLQRNAARDRRTRRGLRRAGWQVLVVWECQVSPRKLNRLRERLAKFLGSSE
jgi:DNA mismatch endonuclease, patch repair protein